MQSIVLRRLDFLTGDNYIYDGKVPQRMNYLRDIVQGPVEDFTYTPWGRLAQVNQYMSVILSDVYRSPASSAEAYARKTGVAKPGYSGHNYGVSIDLAIDAMLHRHSEDYPALVRNMIAFGWTPYQGVKSSGNYIRGKEDWHFNFIGDFASNQVADNSIAAGSEQINQWINSSIEFETDLESIQRMLFELRFYQGAIDGAAGKFTSEAIKKFKRAWQPAKLLSLGINDTLDELTVRLINIVSARVIDIKGNHIA